jgi:hypothetical protein
LEKFDDHNVKIQKVLIDECKIEHLIHIFKIPSKIGEKWKLKVKHLSAKGKSKDIPSEEISSKGESEIFSDQEDLSQLFRDDQEDDNWVMVSA